MQAIETGRREYRITGWLKTLYLLLGLMLMGFGIFIANLLVQQKNYGLAVFIGALPLVPAFFILAMALRSCLVIDGTRFEVHYALTEKTADLSEVEGYRTISSRNGSFWRLQLKEGRGSISIYKWFNCVEVRAWLAQIPDLDERDRKAVLEQIEQDHELGATPEERLARVVGAKRMNIALSTIAIVAALGYAFGGATLHLPSATVLALLPAALIYLVHSQPLLYGFVTPKRDPRANLTTAFLVSAFGLILGNSGVHFVEKQSLLMYSGLAALLCCAGILSSARKNPAFAMAMILMVIFSCAYGWGLAAAADSVPDKSPPAKYTATVVNKHLTSGRSTTYYLDLSPWGPLQGANDVSVPHSTYQSAAIGDSVCLQLHAGALHVQWYQRVTCEGTGQ